MPQDRRTLLASAAGAGLLSGAEAAQKERPSFETLDRAAARPVLRLEGLRAPVRIAGLELLHWNRRFLVRARSTDGTEAIIVPNEDRMRDVYPVFLHRIAPFFVGKDARELEALLQELYREGSNYKFQGLALWVCVAAAEFALLELLGKASGKPLTDLLGGARRREIAIYRASGNRGNTPEQ
ncbi:MAG: mandelate racemase/muconate lactonizing enzyme family protein, partial [Armatimonadetes bacterium]|nr:mandelate racemase/muconate lactonizing enzyme family protein [Armatimonadota bacterium]